MEIHLMKFLYPLELYSLSIRKRYNSFLLLFVFQIAFSNEVDTLAGGDKEESVISEYSINVDDHAVIYVSVGTLLCNEQDITVVNGSFKKKKLEDKDIDQRPIQSKISFCSSVVKKNHVIRSSEKISWKVFSCFLAGNIGGRGSFGMFGTSVFKLSPFKKESVVFKIRNPFRIVKVSNHFYLTKKNTYSFFFEYLVRPPPSLLFI